MSSRGYGLCGALRPGGSRIEVSSLFMVSLVLTGGVRQLGLMCIIKSGDSFDVGLSAFVLFIVLDVTVVFVGAAYF